MRRGRHRQDAAALRLLAALADDFPDGTWFVELGELRQPELVVPGWPPAVGVDEEPERR